MAFARFAGQGLCVPPPTKMVLYGLETAQELMVTIRDLRRIVKIGTEWAHCSIPQRSPRTALDVQHPG